MATQQPPQPLAPAVLAKGALKRLALAHQEPTPENYARAYAEESGQPVASGAAQAQAVAALVERVVRGVERGSKQWTPARKKESLQRVLDGSRSDLQRLQQRLSALVTSWEQDAPPAADEAAHDAAAAPGDTEAPEGAADAAPAAPEARPTHHAWGSVVGTLQGAIGAGLGAGEAGSAETAGELADGLARLADEIARDGPAPAAIAALDELCTRIRRQFAHRHHLYEQLGRLCNELSQSLAELAEDPSWAQGQAQALHARLAEGISARSVRAVSEMLAETRSRQQRVRADRDAARDALKQLIHRLLGELAELGAHTDRFQENVGRHVEAIERADSLESLAGVVRELVDEGRAVQSLVRGTQQRLASEHSRAVELEARVRDLEGELRRLSEEVSTDALTRVANRRGLQQAFRTECARAERDAAAGELAVALLDIDNFKKLNDTHGHAAGDEALRSLAAAVRERLRPGDHLARFGGEEFVVLLPATKLEDAQLSLTRLQRSLSAALFMHEEQEIFVTFSAGVTAWRAGESLEQALERADEALYEAKRTGKNRTCTA